MFKPLLAATVEDVNDLQFPLLASQKLDGVRATEQEGKLMSRSLKPIANKNVQAMFKGLPDGLDGELIYGSTTAPDVYRNTQSIVNSDDKPADGIKLHVFDKYGDQVFFDRLQKACAIVDKYASTIPLVIVQHVTIRNVSELELLEEKWLEEGHEGVMLRDLNGRYKEGRSTLRERILVKLKRFTDSEAEILSCYEMMHNHNEAKTNELGRTERSSHKANKVASGLLGGFNVRDLKTGIEFQVGTGFTLQDKTEFWAQRESLVGKIVKYKSFSVGVKERPRHPVYLGFRTKEDM